MEPKMFSVWSVRRLYNELQQYRVVVENNSENSSVFSMSQHEDSFQLEFEVVNVVTGTCELCQDTWHEIAERTARYLQNPRICVLLQVLCTRPVFQDMQCG
jgi:hypothetical protein